MKNINAALSDMKYRNKWVALDDKTGKVVGADKSAKIAYEQAQKKGVKIPILTRVPKNYGATYVLIAA